MTRVCFKKQQVVGRGEPFDKLRASGQKAEGSEQKAAGRKKGVFWLFIPERLAQTAYCLLDSTVKPTTR
ncbi:MAG: hypothetical protein GWN93_15300 [Deltaproteobacteria bacterium]|nr:hypothetical protein [Deltaproteobacteria bacterium]